VEEARTWSRRGALPGAAAMLLLPVALGLGASPAAAQEGWETEIRSQLQSAGQRLETVGYAPTGQVSTGSLNNGSEESVSVALEGGGNYAIVGVCDSGCRDLDLVAFDGAGNEVASDQEMDDTPMVNFSATQTGTWRLQVTMASCTADPCHYSLAVYAR
jgi:hypothetical protein